MGLFRRPLTKTETASVSASARGATRFLFAILALKNNGNSPEAQLPPKDETLTLDGVSAPKAVTLLAGGEALKFSYDATTRVVTAALPAARRTTLVDVVQIELAAGN